jgi:YHS domain-containing protein
MLRLILGAMVALAVPVVTAPASAAATYTGVFSDVAVGGYDAVSYFVDDGRPVKGDKRFSVRYRGAEYRFANAANAARFKASPAAFAPQYGGHCAWAVSQNYTAPGDPRHYRVVSGKLYLNYNGEVQAKWVKNMPGFIASGDRNWPALATE